MSLRSKRNKLTRDLEIQKANTDEIQRISNYINYMKKNPLSQHHLCPGCGWIGYKPGVETSFSTIKAVATAAAIGGTVATAAGCSASIIGISLIIIGIPLLFFFGLGVIPIAIGGIIMSVGGTASSAGATVALSGINNFMDANRAINEALSSPANCPTCFQNGLIPAGSPMAKHYCETVPSIRDNARLCTEHSLANLPSLPKQMDNPLIKHVIENMSTEELILSIEQPGSWDDDSLKMAKAEVISRESPEQMLYRIIKNMTYDELIGSIERPEGWDSNSLLRIRAEIQLRESV